MQHFLFVHFKERRTPDGEQIYFAVSKDGFTWEQINNGQPVLWAVLNEKGVRDATVVRTDDGKFYIIATDLSLAYNMRTVYNNDWHRVQLIIHVQRILNISRMQRSCIKKRKAVLLIPVWYRRVSAFISL